MARTSKLSDDVLRDYVTNGFTQKQIAALCGVTEAAISKRVKILDKRAAAKTPARVLEAHASLWNVREATEENYQRCLALLAAMETDEEAKPGDKVRALGEVRQHLQFAMSVLETLYAVTETQAFMEEVLNVLGECDPVARQKVLSRLAEKRALRAAFLPAQ
jgi:predicted transcriptional regulator